MLFSTTIFAQQRVSEAKQLADRVIHLFMENRFAEIFAMSTRDMQAAADAEQLEGIWNGLIMQYDTFSGYEEIRANYAKGFYLTTTPIRFGKQRFGLQLNFDSSLTHLAGLFFTSPDVKYTPADYVHPEWFTEYKIPLLAKGYQTEAVLSVPNKNKPSQGFPVVIIVHGSGGIDKDLSLGPNKVYKDLAWGLACKGIAVFRYDKRTKSLLKEMIENDKQGKEPYTVKNEYLYDVQAAVAILQKRSEIDSKQIFILGHSEGAYLIPYFNSHISKVAGFISLAGTYRPIAQVAMEQIDYLMPDSALNESLKIKKKNILRSMENSLPDHISNSTSNDSVMQPWTSAYWNDLKKYHPEKEALKIRKPYLLLQGNRDYQIRKSELDYIHSILGDKANIQYMYYPALNHLFLPGEGALSKPSEYEIPNNVPEEVMRDIRDFIMKQKR